MPRNRVLSRRATYMTAFSSDLLEFDRLLGIIAAAANSDVSRTSVQSITPLQKRDEILERQQQVHEIMRMSADGKPLSLSEFEDITPLIAKTRPHNSVLDARELAALIPVLSIAKVLSGQIGSTANIPALTQLAGDLTGCPELLKVLRKSVNTEGDILDTASLLLAEIRDKIRKLEARIRKRLEEMVRDKNIEIFLQDDFITKRSGRWVIPVRMDSKGQVSGVVHDVSNSGETAFIEPLEIINSTNEFENLVAEQKTEEIRILRTLTSGIRHTADIIESEFITIVRLDMLHCIAFFAEQHRMTIPVISGPGEIHIVRARHPLLFAALKKAGREDSLVPLDVSLGNGNTVMVVTGSNAGGKTIAIKTVGLLLLMALSGMPAPADESSRFPLVRNLLVDIGDDQSIENSLSTFSAHIENISRILENAGPDSLVLIDELGTGTDPEEGGALACAVLKELHAGGALVFATTHLADIKGFVHRTEGMLNASMEFDQKTLMPLYRLRKGEPGQSHALDTARRYGLPDRIVASAKSLLGSNKVEFDAMVADLNLKRQMHEEAAEGLLKQQQELSRKIQTIEEERKALKEAHKKGLAEAYQKASDIVSETKRQMHDLLDEMKKKDKEEIKRGLRNAQARQKELVSMQKEFSTSGAGVLLIEEIKEGDTVHVKSMDRDATVIQVNKGQGRIKVQAGGIEIELPVSALAPAGRPAGKVTGGSVTVPPSGDSPVSRINLVGERVDDALTKLEPFLNHAALSGIGEVTIIHGFGTGVLGRAVREHLKGHPLINKFRPGEQSEGGAGVTVAALR